MTRDILVVVVVAVVTFSGIWKLSEASCRDAWPSNETRYTLTGVCLVKLEQGWAASRNIRVDP